MPTTNEDFLIRVKADIDQATAELRKFTGEVKKSGEAGDKSAQGIGRGASQVKTLVAAASAYLALDLVNNLIHQADAWAVLQARIKTATRETGDYNQVAEQLYQINQKNGQEMQTTVALFQNLARTAPALKATNQDMLNLANTVQQLGVISGTTLNQQRAGLLQFTQGLASTVFRAEEFNSLIENLPELANRIAKGMGKTTGELRTMVIQGKALSRDVFKAIQSQAVDINQQFQEMPDAVIRAGNAMDTSFKNLLGSLDKAIGGTTKIAALYREISERLDYSSELLQEDELAAAMRERVALMQEYQSLRAAGITEQHQDMVVLLRLIDEADNRIKALQPKVPGNLDFVGPPNPPKATPLAVPDPISPAEQKKIDDYAKSIQKLTDRLDPASAATHQLQTDLALLNKLFFEDQSISADRYDQLTDSLLGSSEAAKQAVEELDAMDRAMDLIDQQFADLDEAEARQIAGLDKITTTGKQGFSEMEAAIRGWGDTFTNTLVDMAVTGELSFKRLADAIIADLLRIAVYQNLTKPLFAAAGFDLGGTTASVNHAGGIIGAGGTQRAVNPMAFINAPRYHSGGIAGLKSNEVPAILQQGEEVLTRNDPRHAANQGAGMKISIDVNNQNTPIEAVSTDANFDGDDLVISVFTRDIRRGGSIDDTLQRTYNLTRK